MLSETTMSISTLDTVIVYCSFILLTLIRLTAAARESLHFSSY
jgi:hypothetical protein